MKTEDDLIEALARGAMSYASAEARAAYLDAGCGADVEIRARVEARLGELGGGTTQPDAALGPMPAWPDLSSPPAVEKPGDRIGRYRLLQKLGEGGFGVVYLAEQEQPVQRRVALKVIKLGMDTGSVVARFEAERQALALMDHPGIARVLDGGMTSTGRPFFVMELVKGVRLTDYCDQTKVSTRERLELFIQVCHAVQHAHQKGIVHRDIKPSNILVTVHQETAAPKVIDFGIAKAMDRKLTDKTVFTELEQFIGTPAYVSPEQAEMSGLDIDTRSDIYSLGVLLYELLTGRTPFDTEQLARAGLDEIRRKIREEEPPRPSTRLTTLGAAELEEVARRHRSEPGKLPHALRGDLDWIVMKALEKDRTRRYESASALARDIERHLNHEPVEAAAPSLGYRFGKFARRNKLALTAAGAVLGALLLGAVTSAWQAVRAGKARQTAEINWMASETNRQSAEELIAFMMGDLSDRLEPLSRMDLMQAVLERAAAYFEKMPAGQVTLESEFNHSLLFEHVGRWRYALTQDKAAESNFLAALQIRKRLAEHDPTRTEWQRGVANASLYLADVNDRLGNATAMGDYLQASLGVLTNLVKQTPTDLNAQALLGMAHVNLGWQVRFASGETASLRSLGHLQTATQIFQNLTNREPWNKDWRLWLSRCLSGQANYHYTRFERGEAVAKRLEAMLILSNLVGRSSQSLSWKEQLGWNHIRLAEVYIDMAQRTELASAREQLNFALEIFQDLARQEMTSLRYVHSGLAQAYAFLGDLDLKTHPDLPVKAAGSLRNAWHYSAKLVRDSPTDVLWQGQEKESFNRFVGVCLDSMSQARATGEIRSVRTLWRELIESAREHSQLVQDPRVAAKVAGDLFENVFIPSEITHPQARAAGARAYRAPASYMKLLKDGPGRPGSKPRPIIGTNALWTYRADLADPGKGWLDPDLGAHDTAWETGRAVLGFGEETLVDTEIKVRGSERPVTFYFRHNLEVERPETVQALCLNLLVDDGAAVYLNGKELLRDNLPESAIHHRLLASGLAEARRYVGFILEPGPLLQKSNVVAVEVHQSDPWSGDLVFGLELLDQVPTLEDWLQASGLPSIVDAQRAALDLTELFQSDQQETAQARFVPTSYRNLMVRADGGSTPGPPPWIGMNSEWRFLDSGKDPGTAWREPDFAMDAGWKIGRAPLGYPDFRVRSVLNYGGEDVNKYITYWFRKEFAAEPDQAGPLLVRGIWDDGVVLYLNGEEILRDGMPQGEITPQTLAVEKIERAKQFNYLVQPSRPLGRRNVLAAEVHQVRADSTDLYFDLELLPGGPDPKALLNEADQASLLRFFEQEGITLPGEAQDSSARAFDPPKRGSTVHPQ